MFYSLLLSILLVARLSCAHKSKQCFNFGLDENGQISSPALDYNLESTGGVLKINGTRFNLKGVSWFGFETSNYCVHGLWAVDYHSLVNFMANYSFNGLRLPFSCYLILNDPPPDSINFYQMNGDLKGLSSLQVMDKIIQACAEAGILVMLDMHSLEAGGFLQDGLWYDDAYPQSTTLQVWKTLAKRYKNQWNVVAADIFNEPFAATWGVGDTSTDFNTWCETAGNAILAITDWLIMCEGVADSPPCAQNCFWGEDLQGVATHPVKLNTARKVVYSPHVYGPSVSYQDYFSAPDFPKNMPAIWNAHWAFIRGLDDAAITVGEWGGQMSGADLTWMDAFASYLSKSQLDAPDNWFWCLNPDSGDTGGLLLNDWVTPVIPKLDLLQTVQPRPTKVIPNYDYRNRKLNVCFVNE